MAFGFIILVIGAFWLAARALVGELHDGQQATSGSSATAFAPVGTGRVARVAEVSGDEAARDAGAVENERVLVFKDRESLEAFLAAHGADVTVLGRIDALNALRVASSDMASLVAALGDDHEEMFVFPVFVPAMPEGDVQAGAVEVGNRVLEWLGVQQAAANWGAGVKIAVLDTGVLPDATMGKVSQFIELVRSGADISLQNAHGTAVASLIIGQTAEVPGVAPAAEIISVRVADDNGVSNSFLLARGIVEAVDAGAELINISMGGLGRSDLLQQAVDYALERGALVIAATGNHGMAQVQYPAGLDGVIGVGAVDALGQHLEFSNSGPGVDVAAPGLGVYANWLAGHTASVSGTSFSAPIVAGTLAAIMTAGSTSRLSAMEAWQLMADHLNDGGAAGADAELGAGMPDLWRVLNRGVAGIYDAAVASMTMLPPDAAHPYGQVEVLVQNRGTETLVNTGLNIEVAGVLQRVNLTSLDPGESQPVRAPINEPLGSAMVNALTVNGMVWLTSGGIDARPGNDARTVVYGPAP